MALNFSPETVFTEETLNKTYQGEMMVVHHDGMILIHQRPHPHTYRDILPNPVPGHSPSSLRSPHRGTRPATESAGNLPEEVGYELAA